jgi:syntaxin 5
MFHRIDAADLTALSAAGPSAARATAQQHSEFAKKASAIGLAIHRTSLKLQKLAQLAKRSSMFDDPGAEIDELTGIIKQDIQDLNTAIAELQRISSRKEEGNKQSADHSHTVSSHPGGAG